jgi:hypothetical protein
MFSCTLYVFLLLGMLSMKKKHCFSRYKNTMKTNYYRKFVRRIFSISMSKLLNIVMMLVLCRILMLVNIILLL